MKWENIMNQTERMAQEGNGFQGNPDNMMQRLQEKLDVSDIDFRVGRTGIQGSGPDAKAWGTLLAYKDSRVDMRRLDDVTNGLWKNTFHRDSKGVLQCEISIYMDSIGEWVSKVSNGVSSQFEAEKGEYSDAFKRAGFMWGIGRELYDLPELFFYFKNEEVSADDRGKKVKVNPTYKFKPNEWIWTLKWDHVDQIGNLGLIHAKERGSTAYRIKPKSIFLKHQIRKDEFK